MVGLKFNTVPICLLIIIFHEIVHVQSLRSRNSELKYRNKRETGTVQAIDKDTFLSELNRGRGNVIPTANKMTCMNWDDTLAKKAQDKAVTCDKSGQTQTQAITLDSDVKTLSQALTKWSNEAYDLFSNFCFDPDDPTCVNYKLLYNDQASTVGCAIASCAAGFLTVCEFNSAISSDAPYTGGPKACGACPSAFPQCFSKLCSVSATTCLGSTQTSSSAMSGSTSTSAHSTKGSTTTTKPSTPPASTSAFSKSTSTHSTKPSTHSTQPPTSSSSSSSSTSTSTSTSLTSTSTSTTSSPPKSTSTSSPLPSTKRTTPSTPTTKPLTSSSTTTTSTPKRSTGTPCVDTLTTAKCSKDGCDSSPGTMYRQCRQTCDNCDGCTCKDSKTFNCTYYAGFDYCRKYPQKMTEFCPLTCNLCNAAKSSICTKVL